MDDSHIEMHLERELGMPDDMPQLLVGFGMMQMLDHKLFRETKREEYTERLFFKCQVPGDKTFLYLQPATEDDKRKFPRTWKAYNEGIKAGGTPIEQWAGCPRSVAALLKSKGVKTVEALAEIHEGNIERMGFIGARELRDKARKSLADIQADAKAKGEADDKAALQAQLAAMQATAEAMAAKIAELESAGPRRRRQPAEPVNGEIAHVE